MKHSKMAKMRNENKRCSSWLLLVLGALVGSVLSACGMGPRQSTAGDLFAEPTAVAGGELVVFAAASLTKAFEEVGASFETANPGTTIVFNFAGSQQLAQQIGQGAPVDVFASANPAQMNVVVEAGDVVTGTQQVFVRNRLVVIYPSDNPAGLERLQDLATPGVRLVLAAAEVPAGEYSLAFLDEASADPAFGESFRAGALGNVVSYEESVRAVLSKVALGEADAGIVYTSDVSADASEVGQIPIPDELNTIATYPIAPIMGSEQPEAAQRFIQYVLSAEGQAILARYGFIPVAEGG
jgi:molybdate transport system substrate-binding protein